MNRDNFSGSCITADVAKVVGGGFVKLSADPPGVNIGLNPTSGPCTQDNQTSPISGDFVVSISVPTILGSATLSLTPLTLQLFGGTDSTNPQLQFSFGYDNTSPSTPSLLSTPTTTASSISFSAQSTDMESGILGYAILYAECTSSSSCGVDANWTDSNAQFFDMLGNKVWVQSIAHQTITGLKSHTTYRVTVTPYDNVGNAGTATAFFATTPSNVLTVTSPASGTPNPVASGGTVALSFAATDLAGRGLYYSWTALCSTLGSNGIFSDQFAQSPTWRAPANTTGSNQTCMLTVVFNDVQGLSQQSSYQQTVSLSNPVPTLAAIDPTSASVGTGPISITLTGTNFVPTSVVQLGSTQIVTTFVSSTTLKVLIPSSYFTSSGTLNLVVVNPSPGGGTSSSSTLTIVSAAPTITSITPTTGTPGSTFILVVTGTNLNGTMAAIFSGGGISATIGPGGTSTIVSLLVTIAANAEQGARTLTITAAGGTSQPFGGFVVQQPHSGRPTTAPLPIPEVEQGNIQTGYIVLTPDQNTSAPLVTMTFGTVQNGVVQDQAGVVPFGVTTGATVFIDFLNSASRSVGIAIANPANITNAITITLKTEEGAPVGAPITVNIEPYKQVSKFVNELFSEDVVGLSFLGSISVQSGIPFALLGLRFAGASFSTVLPGNIGTVSSVPARTLTVGSNANGPMAGMIGGSSALMLPQFAIGGGWATEIAMVNPSSATYTGRIDVFDFTGQPLVVKLNGSAQSTFTYTIPAGGTFVLAPRDTNGQSPL